MGENNNKFEYTYSAVTEKERKQVEEIRSRYMKPLEEKEDDFSRLQRLDKKVKTAPTVWGLVFGILGTLIFGLGLSMILEWDLYLFGTMAAVVGLAVLSAAYFIYTYILKKNKQRYGEEILRLSESLLVGKESGNE